MMYLWHHNGYFNADGHYPSLYVGGDFAINSVALKIGAHFSPFYLFLLLVLFGGLCFETDLYEVFLCIVRTLGSLLHLSVLLSGVKKRQTYIHLRI